MFRTWRRGIAVQEMEDIFKMLIGTPHYTKQNVLPEEITADYFAENILGFEEVDEVEEEGEGQQEQMWLIIRILFE